MYSRRLFYCLLLAKTVFSVDHTNWYGNLASNVELRNFPKYEIRELPQHIRTDDAIVPEILVIDRGHAVEDGADADRFAGSSMVRRPSTTLKEFTGSERDFEPTFERSKYREPYKEAGHRPLVVDWNQHKFRTVGNYDLLRDDESGVLLLYSTGKVVEVKSPDQLNEILRAASNNVRRKRELDQDDEVTQFMPYFLAKYLKLILGRLSKEGIIQHNLTITEIVQEAIEESFKKSKLYEALWSGDRDDIGAQTVFNNIDWWSEPIQVDDAGTTTMPLIDLILEHLFRGALQWMCEQRLINTDKTPVAQWVRHGLAVMRTGPIYGVIMRQSEDRQSIELLEQCEWWRRDGRLIVTDDGTTTKGWMPIAN